MHEPTPASEGLTYAYLIDFDALLSLSPETLRAFLAPYATWCRSVGVRLDRNLGEPALRRLHQALWSPDVHRPDELCQALIDLGDLAGEWGYETTVRTAVEQWGEGRLDAARNPVELAFREYLLRKNQEMASIARTLHGKGVPRLREYAPREPVQLERHRSESHVDRFREDVGGWFDDRGRTGYSEILCDESTREVQLRVTRGMVPRTQPIIVDGERVERIDFVPARPDLLIFDKRTCVLSINAQLAEEHDVYRRMFGRVFFGSPDHFDVDELYTGDPLLIDSDRALSTDGFPPIREVVLREVRVRGDRNRATFKGDRINEGVDPFVSGVAPSLGADLNVEYARFAFHLRSRKRPTIVEIIAPNRCKVDRRFAGDIVRDFLLARGFLQLPLFGEPADAETVAA